MALFGRQEEKDLELLLALGFTARLRRGHQYVGCEGEDALRLGPLSDAAQVRFVGRAGTSRVVVRVDARYVDIDATLKGEPLLLKLHSTKAGAALRVALSDLRKNSPSFLTLPESGSAGNEPPPEARFEMEVLAVAGDDVGEAMSIPQACVGVAVHLGLRFRIRSVHGRVLRAAGGSGRKMAVLQDGEKTGIDDVREGECVFEPIRKGAYVLLRDTNTDRYLALKPGSDGKNVFLVLVNSANHKNSGAHLVLRASSDVWGMVYLGVVVNDVDSTVKDRDVIEWIMAGMRGRLETRRQQRGWERLHLEFVVQARERALKDLPAVKIFDVAEKNTRERMRAQVAAGVQNARNENARNESVAKKPAAKKGGFDHARALAALSEPEPTPEATRSERPAQEVAAATAARVASRAKPPTEAGTIPRNAQNRKLSKREKRKKRRKGQGLESGNNAGPSNAGTSSTAKQSPAASTPKTARNVDETVSDEPSAESSEIRSSTSSATPTAASGPPCAACGQAIVGPYTTAMGKNFHPGCLVCGKCRIPLTGSGKLHTHNGVPHCSRCYANHCAPRCARCTQPIMDTVVTAMEKTWHRNCLTCTWCRMPLGETFWIYADKPREPHCNNCVGSEARAGGGQRRTVNLPGFGPRSNFGGGGGGVASGAPTTQGGARMHMMPMRPR